jgi:hypothetical protein
MDYLAIVAHLIYSDGDRVFHLAFDIESWCFFIFSSTARLHLFQNGKG